MGDGLNGLPEQETYELYPLGESAAVVRWPGEAGERSLRRLDLAEARLKASAPAWVTEWVRAYTSITVFYDPWLVYAQMQGSGDPKSGRPVSADAGSGTLGERLLEDSLAEMDYTGGKAPADGDTGNEGTPYAWVCAWIREALSGLEQEQEAGGQPGRTVVVPALFGGEAGPDLVQVAGRTGLTPEGAVELYCSAVYTVHLIGFLPGFPYLGGLPSPLAAPRLAQPRALVPAGSIGIAGLQTGIYPVDSPGGWQLIGRTPLRLFDAERTPASLLQPGDRVRFQAVSGEELAELEREAAANGRRLE
ncbi:hypothetical protein PM3016_6478 [Paenibacillus mucilaginosus 3016]|uniref:Carboxyltransferase domain-containing protein n=2 Tax=Paenibacillus mucilaginosus TaxID=61624 RepID=H6NIN7_9BACL|nr:5-oxoprolinase subunit PxpB [Paenibacillus mucilaginosus]AFC33104.1 hypothetical protein PM3016_6478 [Paenibacillus mucilaginosus 3016]AFH65416.2 hypothetical protein B2K_32725 [Paenibacillus mucilaginosus K02]WFA21537.1 5-oxoprolinase subunit PxpB [Paenibacillus mucilaginosus]